MYPAIKIQPIQTDAQLLARKLWTYRLTHSVLIATSSRVLEMAHNIGDVLELPTLRHYCKSIRHPGSANKSIGSVTVNEVILHDNSGNLPAGFVHHQIMMMKNALGSSQLDDIDGKHVILLREEVPNKDEVFAAIEEFKKMDIRSIVLATPELTRKSYSLLEPSLDDIVFLREIQDTRFKTIHDSRLRFQREKINGIHEYS